MFNKSCHLKSFLFLARYVFCRITYLMDNTLLDLSMRKHSFNGLRKSGQAIYAGDKNLLNPSIFQAIHNRKPELGTFIFSDIHAENILFTRHINADCNETAHFTTRPSLRTWKWMASIKTTA